MNYHAEHAFTRAHFWIGVMFLTLALGGSVWVAVVAGSVSLAHIVLGVFSAAEQGQHEEQNR